jgi:metalloendopeptidase OMA1, mitochondrial
VKTRLIKWPINPWPKDPEMKLLGKMTAINVLQGLEGFSFRPLMGFLGKTREEVEALLEEVRSEIKDPKIHAYLPV